MKNPLALATLAVLLVSCGDDPQSTSSGEPGGSAGSATQAGGAGPGGSAGSASGGAGSAGSSGAAGTAGQSGSAASSAIPGGGKVIFEESFEDADFAARGWYDGSAAALSTSEHAEGKSSFECQFAQGASSCSGGKPARHPVTASSSVYLSFHIKFSDNWVGSGKPYHPHMFHFITDADMQYVGPSHTFLTTYTEVVQGKALLALQDSKNVDLNCILKNDDSFVGCNGNFDTYKFTESRSACSCNGLQGFLDGHDCFPNGDGTWYSSRSWHADAAFTDQPGAAFKGDWHFVEVYFELNTVKDGAGVPDGKIRWVQDGKSLISSDQILFRTGIHPDMMFNQFAMLPYIGDGSPLVQTFWIDDLIVATAKP